MEVKDHIIWGRVGSYCENIVNRISQEGNQGTMISHLEIRCTILNTRSLVVSDEIQRSFEVIRGQVVKVFKYISQDEGACMDGVI